MLNAILENYPKKKKDLIVSLNYIVVVQGESCITGIRLRADEVFRALLYYLLQEDIGVETDEDYNVVMPP